MTCLVGLLLFALIGASASDFSSHAFFDAPILYTLDHFSVIGHGGFTVAWTAAAITWEDGTENMGGFKNYIDIIPISDIDEEAKFKDTPTTDADYVTLDGSHALNTGKYFKRVYVTPGTLKFTPENQGEIDGQSFRQKGAFFHPGASDAINAFARQVNNGNFIIILHEENGKRVQCGNVGHPARIKPSPDFGTKAADRKGFNFEFEADSFVAAPRYAGTIPLSETETEEAIS